MVYLRLQTVCLSSGQGGIIQPRRAHAWPETQLQNVPDRKFLIRNASYLSLQEITTHFFLFTCDISMRLSKVMQRMRRGVPLVTWHFQVITAIPWYTAVSEDVRKPAHAPHVPGCTTCNPLVTSRDMTPHPLTATYVSQLMRHTSQGVPLSVFIRSISCGCWVLLKVEAVLVGTAHAHIAYLHAV
jgi:hypothetical protein